VPADETSISSLLIKLAIVVELAWFVWNRSHLAYIIETMYAIATLYEAILVAAVPEEQ
jgi:hypothetical protein